MKVYLCIMDAKIVGIFTDKLTVPFLSCVWYEFEVDKIVPLKERVDLEDEFC